LNVEIDQVHTCFHDKKLAHEAGLEECDLEKEMMIAQIEAERIECRRLALTDYTTLILECPA
jgi:hypothetical protein